MTTSKNDPHESNPNTSGKDVTGPMIVDLGKQPRRRVKRLLRGEGKLMAEVRDCIAELRRTGKISTSAEPIIVVVRQKEPKSRLRLPRF